MEKHHQFIMSSKQSVNNYNYDNDNDGDDDDGLHSYQYILQIHSHDTGSEP